MIIKLNEFKGRKLYICDVAEMIEWKKFPSLNNKLERKEISISKLVTNSTSTRPTRPYPLSTTLSNSPITSSFKPLLIPVELPLTGQYLSKHNLGNKFSTPQNTLEIDRPLYTPRSYSRFPLEQTNSLSHLFKQKARCRYT